MTVNPLNLTPRAALFKRTARFVASTAAVMAFALLQGCAAVPADPNRLPNAADPLETVNRTIFNFNDNLDQAVVKPVATAYRNVTPALVRTGVTNFFSNLSDVWSLVNSVLQAKPADAGETLIRLSVNTFFGLGGLLDIAGEMNISKHTEDFGQTLGYWGVPSGPYLVLPVFGPSTVRDTAALVVDMQGDPVSATGNVPVRNSLTATRLVNLRSSLLGAGELLDGASIDKYGFARDVYLQRRQSLIRGTAAVKEERFDLPEGPQNRAAPAATPAAPAPAAQ